MKYPISPDYLLHAPDPLVAVFLAFERWIINDIARRLKEGQALSSTAQEQIRLLQRMGYDKREIVESVKELAELTDKGFQAIYDDAVQMNEEFGYSLFSAAGLIDAAPEPDLMAATVEAIRRQTADEMQNITRSLGFVTRINGQIVRTPILDAYQVTLDQAALMIDTGAASFDTAVFRAVSDLAASGVCFVDWESGYACRADVAVRRALNTGLSQMSAKYSEQNMENLGTGLVEVTAHRGARDTDGPNGWENHESWHGKVYTMTGEPTEEYPSLHDVCGYGEIDGLCGINCRHHFYAFVDGVSERTYTDEQLRELHGDPITFEGRTMSIYEASQEQRRIERSIRKLKRKILAADACGEEQEYTDLSIRCRRLEQEYSALCEASGLPRQLDPRANVLEFTPKDYQKMEKKLLEVIAE